jgi:hypothetical protein
MPINNDDRGKSRTRSSRKKGATARGRKGRHTSIPLLVKIANAEDEVTSDGFDIFRYRKPLGRKGLIRVPRDKAVDKEVVTLLAAKNADLSIGDPAALQEVKTVLAQPPQEHWLLSGHVGWRRNRKAYVLQNRVIGANIGRRKIKPPTWLNDRQRSVLEQQGDLASWRAEVAEISRYSSRMILMMSAACAAPLLEIAKLQSFWIDVFGRAKSGKTTGLLAAASIIGIGAESQLPNFNITDAGFQETARLFNDSLLPVNELALLGGRKKDAYAQVRQLTYTFSEGRDRSRNSASVYATSASSAMWRGILISTSEASLDSLAMASGQRRDHGELARAHDVPAVVAGRSTIFDKRPANVPKAKSRSWARRQLVRLRAACEKHYGWAIDPIILEIIRLGDGAERYVRQRIAEFLTALDKRPTDGALRHAAENFGCIFAGGCLAINAGLVPWTRPELSDAIVSCFEGFLAVVRKQDAVLERAKGILRQKLSGLKLPLKTEGKDLTSKPATGFYRKTKGRRRYVVNSKTFSDWFPDKAHEMAALSWLERLGKLHKGGVTASPSSRNKKWAVTFPKWSSTQNMRAIEFDEL